MSGSSAVDMIERPVLPDLPPEIRAQRALNPPPPMVPVIEEAVEAPVPEPVVEAPVPEPVVEAPVVHEVPDVEEAPEAPVSPIASEVPVKKLGPAAKTKRVRGTKRKVLFTIAAGVLVGVTIFGLFIANIFENTTLVTKLETGQCVEDFFSSVEGEFREVFLVGTTDCANPHAYEVYSTNANVYGPGVYPGVEDVFEVGQTYCRGEYDRFVGGDFATSTWDVWTFVPTADRWAKNDRTVQCLVGDFNQITLTTGTLEGAGR